MQEDRKSSLEGLSREQLFIKSDEEFIPIETIGHLIVDYMYTETLKIPIITTERFFKDSCGSIGVRLGINRYTYKVPTGLYAVGAPKRGGHLLVTGNYKLSFDALRTALKGIDAFILVLDTQGINVWCAAGKGTFSSKELIYQLNKWSAKKALGIRRVILPQLGSTAMEPHLVRRHTGISVVYGPVRAKDIERFLESNCVANDAMRHVRFSFVDRLVLTPIEWLMNLKLVLYVFLIGFGVEIVRFVAVGDFNGALMIQLGLILIVANSLSSVGFPLLLPIMPFSRFSLNGLLLSLPIVVYLMRVGIYDSQVSNGGLSLVLMAFMSYVCFYFTGSTTFTSQSGVEIELKGFRPLFKILLIVGIALWVGGEIIL